MWRQTVVINISRVSASEPTRWHGLTRDEVERKSENILQQQESSISAQASDALDDMESIALQDTLEDMSLVLGSRLKGKGKALDEEANLLRDENLAQLAEQLGGERLGGMLLELETGDKYEQLLAMYEQGELSFSDAALLLSASVTRQTPGSRRRKALSSLLDQLLEQQQDWALTLFSELELGNLDTTAQEGMRQIVRRHHQQQHQESTEGMWQWFESLREWDNRRQRIRVLLRTFSWELSSGISDIPVERLIASLMNLKKLLLFLGINDYARQLATLISLDPDEMLAELLRVIELRWGHADWFAQRLEVIKVLPEKSVLYLIRLKDILKFLPEVCFLDEQQRKQLLETIEQVIDDMS